MVTESLEYEVSKQSDYVPVSPQKDSVILEAKTAEGDGDKIEAPPEYGQEGYVSNKRDLSLVFGPGATKLEEIIQKFEVGKSPKASLSESGLPSQKVHHCGNDQREELGTEILGGAL